MNGWPKYFRKMRGVLARSGCRQAEIEDLMQDATVRLLEYYRHGVEVREPEAVLVRTVRRLAINHHRDAHSDLYADCPPEKLELIDPGPTPEEAVLAANPRIQLRADRTGDGDAGEHGGEAHRASDDRPACKATARDATVMNESLATNPHSAGGFQRSRVSMLEGSLSFSNNHYGLHLEVI
jgi:hypothetical protein